MENLGCVIYSETKTGINAEWLALNNGKIESGTGIGIRLSSIDEKNIFVGEYEISYSGIDGNMSSKLLLTITDELGYFKLKWKINKEVIDYGIGIKSGSQLLVSYTEVA